MEYDIPVMKAYIVSPSSNCMTYNFSLSANQVVMGKKLTTRITQCCHQQQWLWSRRKLREQTVKEKNSSGFLQNYK